MYTVVPCSADSEYFSTFITRRLQNKCVLHVRILMDSLKEMESISIRNVVGFFFAGLYAVCAVFMKISYNVLFKFQNITKSVCFF